MQSILRKCISTVAAVTLALLMVPVAMSAPAQADDTATPTALANTKLVKVYTSDAALEHPAETFDFVFQKVSVNDLTDKDSIAEMPALGNGSGSLSIAFSAASGQAQTAVGASSWIPDVSSTTAGNMWLHAGEYVYTVTEKAPTSATTGMKYSQAAYTLRIYVANDTGGKLAIQGVTVNKVTDDGGTAVGKKVDPSKDGTDWASGFEFENVYTKSSTLDFQKVVTGDNADMTKKFEFNKFALTLPATADTSATTLKGEIWYDGSKVAGSTDVTFTRNATNAYLYECASSAYLTNGQYIHFASLPVGTAYSFDEVGTTNYIPSATVQTNNEAAVTVSGTYSAGNDISITSTTASNKNVVGMLANKVVVTNTYKTVTPTGILIESLPWILLIIAAIAGLGVFVTKRRRKKIHVA